MSFRTGALLLVCLGVGGSFWYAMSHGWYVGTVRSDRMHLLLALGSVAAFCSSWVLDERKNSRY